MEGERKARSSCIRRQESAGRVPIAKARNNSVALMGYDQGENALPVLVVLMTGHFG